ncbi:MAG TPA: hypothetical protein VFX04_06050 [Rhodanobacteraceae bacterium]|jgi:hypothetical protein|nr:hypothetical protein [Rhodanobacteraceae bacterium]
MNKPGFFALHRFASPCLTVLAACLLLAPAAANATPYVVKMVQQGGNVVATGSGALDLTGLNFLYATQVTNGLWPGTAFITTGIYDSFDDEVDKYSGSITGPTNFGSGTSIFVITEGNGDVVSISRIDLLGNIYVPSGYVFGTALAGSAAWNNASFASLGVTPGTYKWTWGSGAEQSFTLRIAVSEPAALGVFGLGVLLIGAFVGLRRRVA